MDQFQPSAFDQFMLAATKLFIPLWIPLVVGSLIAIVTKATLKFAPIPEGPKNLIMRIAGWIRNATILLVLFFFVVLYWSLNYAQRQTRAYLENAVSDSAQQTQE